ncbi:MAG: metalloenzyme [Ignavibacteria bacterium]|nr:metalloenzyme [Ignavibacteria bacterium]
MKNKVMMIFVDGLGIGKNNPEINPLVRFKFNFFNSFFGSFPTLRKSFLSNKVFTIRPINATMGVSGLPQSGTGQTAIFCGFNASKFIGKHFGPYPYSTLKPLIKEKNIFTELEKKNFKTYFSNAYPQKFFDYLNNGRRTLSVTTFSYLSAGKRLNNINDLLDNRAITAEITNEIWNSKLGYNLSLRTPQEAGKIFYEISQNFHFNLFEYFLTDYAGHSRDFNYAYEVLNKLDGFLEGVITKMNFKKDLLIIISDHGNIEDLSVKGHTRNPAIGIFVGRAHEKFSEEVKILYQLKKRIIDYLES